MANCSTKINLSNVTFKSCGDLGVDMDVLLTSDVSDMTTVKEFENILCSEFIDVKSRKVISSYPTLKALYERYRTSFQGHPQSSAYNYLNMNQFVTLVGDYWIDLIEQVVPSTTLWGSTHTHRNTIFDKQKFAYKKYTLRTCGNVSGVMYPSPTSGLTTTVDVAITDVTNPPFTGPDCLKPTGETEYCTGVYIEQIDHGSEFIGTVNIIGDPNENTTTGDTIVITECDLVVNNIKPSLEIRNGQISFVPTYVGGTAPYTFEWTIGNATNEFAAWTIQNNTDSEEVLVLGGKGFVPTEGDRLCVSLIITDVNGCTHGLSVCYEGEERLDDGGDQVVSPVEQLPTR